MHQYFKSPPGHVLKAVIGASGQVVGKNYVAKHLHPGDLGLHVRLDRKFKGDMTPAQRTAAIEMAQTMFNDALRQLGVETEMGYVPGAIVQLVDRNRNLEVGIVVRDEGDWLMLQQFNAQGQLIRTRRSLHQFDVNEVDAGWTGLKGLILMAQRYKDSDYRPRNVRLNPNHDPSRIRLDQVDDDWLFFCEILNLLDKTYFWDSSKELATRVVQRIHGEENLQALVRRWRKHWSYCEPRLNALRRIEDQDFLRDFVLERQERGGSGSRHLVGGEPLQVAIDRITNPAVLLSIVAEGEEHYQNVVYRSFDLDLAQVLTGRLADLGALDELRELASLSEKDHPECKNIIDYAMIRLEE